MAQSKRQTAKKSSKKSKVVAGSGNAKQKKSSSWLTNSRAIIIIVFAISFGAVGFYLLKSSFAATPSNLTLATWNVDMQNKKDVAAGAKTVLQKANIVGLQQVHTAVQRDTIYKLTQSGKYASSPKAHTANTSATGVESYPIVWRQKEFTRVSEGVSGQVSAGVDGLRPRYIVWVKLKQNSTGKQFYVVNTHMIRDVEINGAFSSKKANVEQYTAHMAKLVEQVKKLQTEKLPVFVAGSFSMDYRKDTGKVSVFPKAALGAIGVKSNWELTNLKGVSAKATTYGSSARLVDYVFAWNANSVSTSVGGSYGSDHKAVFFTASLPGATASTKK